MRPRFGTHSSRCRFLKDFLSQLDQHRLEQTLQFTEKVQLPLVLIILQSVKIDAVIVGVFEIRSVALNVQFGVVVKPIDRRSRPIPRLAGQVTIDPEISLDVEG